MGKRQPPLPLARGQQLVAGAQRTRVRGTAGGYGKGVTEVPVTAGVLCPPSFHLSISHLSFRSFLPSSLSASTSSSLRDQNPSKPPGQAAQQQPSAGGDICSAWTSEDQIPLTVGHGDSSLSKHSSADAFLNCPASVSLPFPLPLH